MNDRDHVPDGRRLSRRSLLLGGGAGLGIGMLAGGAATVSVTAATQASAPPTAAEDSSTAKGTRVPSRGATQAGVARPATPQAHTLVMVADLDGAPSGADVRAAIALLGDAADAATDPTRADPLLLPDGVGDLSITIGMGPRLVRILDPALPGAAELPIFAGDTSLTAELTGGDLLISVCASDAAVVPGVAAALLGAVPGARRRWSQAGVRGTGTGTVARNPLGYLDGVIVPRTSEERAANVWIGSGPAAGGTIAVIRRLRLDITRFHAQPVAGQDRVIGRTRIDGAPLSGGAPSDEADLTAKTPEGEYLVPLRSHVRAAHPSFTGSALMLRRSYAYSNAVGAGAAPDDGLLFISFQNDLDAFVRTQHRLDETDDLMGFATTTASGSFLILPGRKDDSPLGASLS